MGKVRRGMHKLKSKVGAKKSHLKIKKVVVKQKHNTPKKITKKMRGLLWRAASIAFRSGPKLSKAWYHKLMKRYHLSKKMARIWWHKMMTQIKKYSAKKQKPHFWRAFAARTHQVFKKLKSKIKTKPKAKIIKA